MPESSPTPTGIRAPHGASTFGVSWNDGTTSSIPNAILRGYCPCAVCQGHSGSIRYVAGHNSEVREIEPVGHYGLRLGWGDAHGSGIYTFRYLRRLCDLFAEHGDRLPETLPELPRL